MHSLVGFGLPSGAMCLYSRPSIQDSLRARRTVPGFSPVTAIRTFSVTHSLGVRRMTSLIPTSRHIQATAVAPRFKHSFNHFTAVKPFYIPRKVVAASVPLAHPYFKRFVHLFTFVPRLSRLGKRSSFHIQTIHIISSYDGSAR